MSPPELVRIAGAASYDYVGLRLLEVVGGDAWPLATNAEMMRKTKAEMSAHGVGVLDVELAKLQPETRIEDFRPTVEAAAELGARHVLTQAHDPDGARLVDNFGALCDLLASYQLTADVEFLTWTNMRNVDDVMQLIRAAGRKNSGVLIDSLHFFRSGCRVESLRDLPAAIFNYIQIADAPAEAPATTEALIATARSGRLYPGQGGLPLMSLIRELPKDIPIAIEVPNKLLAERSSPEERARDALAATKALVQATAVGDEDLSPEMTSPGGEVEKKSSTLGKC